MADLGGKLPDGVMMEILSRVPPNSLIRFKCVSKSWYALMNDPKFNVSLKNRKVVLLKRFVMNDETGDDGVRFSFLKYPLVVAANDDTSIEVEDVHFPSLVEEFQYYSIHGHSHGLLCLVCEFKTIFLYNPVTRELRKLPPSILYILESGYYDRVKSLPSGIGFGYDQKSMDFKVVRIVKFVTPETDLPSRVEVYDLKKDEWREIETPFPWRVTLWWKAKFQLYYQGFYYWWAVREELGVSVLLWFDMSQDVFGQISLPESFDEVGLDISIKVLNESIVVLGRRVDQNGNEISWDVWEMVKLGGDVVSWSKLFNISPVSSLHTPLEFVGSNQLLIDTCKEACFGLREGQLISYNINTQHFKKLSLEGVAVDGEYQAIVFVKSLISINVIVNGGRNYI